jgi:hypothetical protein
MGQLITPDRVFIGKGMTTYEDAMARGFSVAVVFVRDDGWTLGAPRHLCTEALKLWDGAWQKFMDGEGTFKDIKQFRVPPRPRIGVFGLY